MNSVLINVFKHEGNKMIWSANVTRSTHSTAECRLICNFTRNKVSTQRKWKVLTSTLHVQSFDFVPFDEMESPTSAKRYTRQQPRDV